MTRLGEKNHAKHSEETVVCA